MRQITSEMLKCFHNGDTMSKSNTDVKDAKVFLFGHMIIKRENCNVYVNFCGYPTNTTAERINELCDDIKSDLRFYVSPKNHTVEDQTGKSHPVNDWILVK